MASLFVYFVAAVGICVLILKVTEPTYIEEALDWKEVPEWVNFPSSVEQMDLNDMLREIIDSHLFINGFRGKNLQELSDHLVTASIIYAKGCVRLSESKQN
jgi:hypothetical protein